MIKLPAPRRISSETMALVASQIDGRRIEESAMVMQNWYSFVEKGLMNIPGELMPRKGFSVFAPFLGRSFAMDAHVSTSKRLLRRLIRWRVVPVTETPAAFDVWFDVASKRHWAYIRLSVRCGRFCSFVCADGIDEAVLDKVEVVGTALGKVIEECCPTGSKKDLRRWRDEIE